MKLRLLPLLLPLALVAPRLGAFTAADLDRGLGIGEGAMSVREHALALLKAGVPKPAPAARPKPASSRDSPLVMMAPYQVTGHRQPSQQDVAVKPGGFNIFKGGSLIGGPIAGTSVGPVRMDVGIWKDNYIGPTFSPPKVELDLFRITW